MKRTLQDYVNLYQSLTSERQKSIEKARKQSSIELFAPIEKAAKNFTVDALKKQLIYEYRRIERGQVERKTLVLIESELDYGDSNIFATLPQAFSLKRWKWGEILEKIAIISFCTITIGISLFFVIAFNSNILAATFLSIFIALLSILPLAVIYENCLNATLKNCRRILLEELRYLFLELESLKLEPSVQIEVKPVDSKLIIRLQVKLTDTFIKQLKTI